MQQKVIKPEEIIKAYEKYQDEMLIIDYENARPNNPENPMVYYINLFLRSIDNEDHKLPLIIRFNNISTSSNIKPPTERQYEQVKLSFNKEDTINPDSNFGKAIELLSNAFKYQVKKLKDDGKITDDEDNESAKVFPSVKPQTPYQTVVKKTKDKNGSKIIIENPLIWINLNTKRYKQDELIKLPIMDDAMYQNAYIKEMECNIYDIEKPTDSVTKFERATVDDEVLNNSNIHKFITYNSIVSGNIMMQAISSKNSFNLNTKIYKSIYVKQNIYNTTMDDGFEDDDINEMLNFTNKSSVLTAQSVKNPVDANESDSDSDSDESDNSDDE